MWYAKNSPIMFGFAYVVALQILQKKRKDDVRIKLSFFTFCKTILVYVSFPLACGVSKSALFCIKLR